MTDARIHVDEHGRRRVLRPIKDGVPAHRGAVDEAVDPDEAAEALAEVYARKRAFARRGRAGRRLFIDASDGAGKTEVEAGG
jgi:hypothetical protein